MSRVVIGSSLTRPLNLIADTKVFCTPGATLPIVNHLIQADKDIRDAVLEAKTVVIMAGGNDVDNGKEITIVWDWGKISQKIHNINPHCKVLICSIFPRATFSNEKQSLIRELFRLGQTFERKYCYKMINISKFLWDSKKAEAIDKYFTGGLHFSDKGARIVKEKLRVFMKPRLTWAYYQVRIIRKHVYKESRDQYCGCSGCIRLEEMLGRRTILP